MNDSKNQSAFVIGIGMIVLAGVIFYCAMQMPRISVNDTTAIAASQDYSYSESIAVSNQNSYSSSSENDSVARNQYTSDSVISYPINLNTCSVEDLMSINGIGDKKASLIIEYREYLGKYTSVEQIKDIKGIGDSVYAKIAPYLTV